MQPHASLGINFRKHFEPFGYSKARSGRVLERKIKTLQLDVKNGYLPAAVAEKAIKEIKGLLRQMRK
jgi:hypothetical protein